MARARRRKLLEMKATSASSTRRAFDLTGIVFVGVASIVIVGEVEIESDALSE